MPHMTSQWLLTHTLVSLVPHAPHDTLVTTYSYTGILGSPCPTWHPGDHLLIHWYPWFPMPHMTPWWPLTHTLISLVPHAPHDTPVTTHSYTDILGYRCPTWHPGDHFSYTDILGSPCPTWHPGDHFSYTDILGSPCPTWHPGDHFSYTDILGSPCPTWHPGDHLLIHWYPWFPMPHMTPRWPLTHTLVSLVTDAPHNTLADAAERHREVMLSHKMVVFGRMRLKKSRVNIGNTKVRMPQSFISVLLLCIHRSVCIKYIKQLNGLTNLGSTIYMWFND